MLLRNQTLNYAIFYSIVIFMTAMITWAAIVEIDEVTRGDGKVIPSTKIKTVQSYDGGILKELHVKLGDHVSEGQLLALIDDVDSRSEYRKTDDERLALTASRVRLEAESREQSLDFNVAEFSEIPETLVAREAQLFNGRKQALEGRLRQLSSQLEQRRQDLASFRAELKKLQQVLKLSRRELKIMRPLVAQGIEPELELIRLEQEVIRTQGDSDKASLNISKTQDAIRETEEQIQSEHQNYRVKALEELNDVNTQLARLENSLPSLSEKLRRTEIRSPINGVVNQVLISTIGGVIERAKPIFEIVPLEDKLVVEAKVLPKDIAFVAPNQPARVKITAYDFSRFGAIDGRVVTMSPDALTEQDGTTYYVARVETSRSTLDAYGESYPIMPGMQAQVDFITGRRTVLEYILKPVLKIKENAFSER
ncbi:HlyD family type I secretion periplasmic adaptor subunit [Pontibacterium granulatum]|uniref:HlyD family type I secretion periplasmic adaptor subunit n=1 Tax=Pontibacterium granulatum TaxID=2036029 RepID=UPI00249B23D2|nr:HlyD family type I secretion periplasmic adaptor subunit [Pontibacterium granulatum]MDI3325056.1 HlyD family type I secretion periplasmic adaptor subunit [Pontibacterium granulatum]